MLQWWGEWNTKICFYQLICVCFTYQTPEYQPPKPFLLAPETPVSQSLYGGQSTLIKRKKLYIVFLVKNKKDGSVFFTQWSFSENQKSILH